MGKLIVEGQKPLKGTVSIGGSKNATLPILAASLLTKETCTLHNVPDIADVHSMIEILRACGSEITFEENTLTITTPEIKTDNPPAEQFKKMRASVMLLGPFLTRNKEARFPYPGGCVLGKRSLDTHLIMFERMGAEILEGETEVHVKASQLKSGHYTFPEMSVTAAENIIIAAAATPGTTTLSLVAMEPHVEDMCNFLNSMGAKISGVGTHTLTIEGVEAFNGTEYSVTSDYLQAGTFAIAAAITKGEVTITDIDPTQLEALWEKMDEAGVEVTRTETSVTVKAPEHLKPVKKLHTAVHPGFPTDLQAPFAVLLTQAEGDSIVFETLFEGRLNYLVELEQMGAKVEIQNPHQAIIKGPTPLKGMAISSCDIRAGAAMVLAALIAKGETEIFNVNYIDRGYENLEEKLNSLGASVRRVKPE